MKNLPDKIYLQVCGDCNANDCENCKFEDLEDNVTWCKDKIFDKDVEYVRTDAFIEKASKWMKQNVVDYLSDTGVAIVFDEWNGIEEFRNAMKL